jgi:putative transposase
MIRAHKIRLNPTPEQEIYLKKACGTARFAFNWGLSRWKEAKEQRIENYGPMAIKKEFNTIKRELFPWTLEVTKNATEDGFRRLSNALSNYFNSKNGQRKGEKVGFPKFKSKKKSKQSFTLDYERFVVDGHWLRIQKLSTPVNMAEALRFAGKIKWGTISCTAGKWYIAITVEIEPPVPVEHPHRSVGVDLGLKTLATLSDGREFENQKLLRSELSKLKRLNRVLSRRQPGSKRWHKAKERLARFHERIANRRKDAIHKMTTEIARTYQVIGVEDLNVKGMGQNRRLAFSIADAGFGEILRQQGYKSEASGGLVIKVGRFFASSKTCSACGYVNAELTLSDRTWVCVGCGSLHDRDWNASKNLEREALRLAYDASDAGSGYVGVSSWTECKTPVGAILGEASTYTYI